MIKKFDQTFLFPSYQTILIQTRKINEKSFPLQHIWHSLVHTWNNHSTFRRSKLIDNLKKKIKFWKFLNFKLDLSSLSTALQRVSKVAQKGKFLTGWKDSSKSGSNTRAFSLRHWKNNHSWILTPTRADGLYYTTIRSLNRRRIFSLVSLISFLKIVSKKILFLKANFQVFTIAYSVN